MDPSNNNLAQFAAHYILLSIHCYTDFMSNITSVIV